MKIGIVYTSTTPELIATVEGELRRCVGDSAEFLSYQDPSILAEVRERLYVTPGAVARLMGMFAQAVSDGADVVLNCCSSVGEAADCAADFGRFAGAPIVRIDEEMCREAVRTGRRVGVMATLPSTLEPTKNTILRVARELNRRVELTDALLENAFGIAPEAFRERMLEKAGEIADGVDCILFAQGSMAYCERAVSERYGKPVLSSPRFGAEAVARTLRDKGLIANQRS